MHAHDLKISVGLGTYALGLSGSDNDVLPLHLVEANEGCGHASAGEGKHIGGFY